MARQLRIHGASIKHPDERGVSVDQRTGPFLYVGVISDDLKGKPLHQVRLTEDEAIDLIADLSRALATKRRLARDAARRGEP